MATENTGFLSKIRSKIISRLAKIKALSNFNPPGKIASKLVSTGKKVAIGTGLLAAALLAYFSQLGMAALNGALTGAAIGGVTGGIGGAYVGATAGAAIGTVVIPIPIVGTVVGATVGGLIGGSIGLGAGASIGAIAGGLIGLGLASGKATLISAGTGTAVGATIGAFAGYAAGAAAWGLVVAACAAVTGGTCAALAIFTPAAGAIGSMIGAAVGAAIGGTVGYFVGEYVLTPATHFFSGAQVVIKTGWNNFTGYFTQPHIPTPEISGGGIAHSVASGASWVGNGFVGGLSWLWNGAVGWIGHAISLGGSLISSFTGLFSSGGSAAATTMATVGVTAAISTVTAGTVLTMANTQTNFFNSEGESGPTLPPGENQYFSLTKTADVSQISAPGQDVTFTIKLTAKSQGIKSHTMTDLLNYRDSSGTISAPITKDIRGHDISLILASQCPFPTPIAAGDSCSPITITISTSAIPNNSVIVNTVTANVTMDDGTQKTESATASVNIGSPPAACPSGWPTRAGQISQGPMGHTSHGDPPVEIPSGGLEAIDDAQTNENVYATVDGVVDLVYQGKGLEDYRVDVVPIGGCPNLTVVSYWHLLSTNVKANDPIKAGTTQIGVSGLEGSGYHMHYQFNRAFDRSVLITDHLPKPVPRPCNSVSECGVSIP